MTTNAEQYPWQSFDNSLFELKIRAPIRELRERAEAEKRRVRFEFRKSGNVNDFALEYGLQDCDLQVLEEWAALYDRLAREVWSIHGRAVTPAFVRMIFERLILPLLAVRQGSIDTELQFKAVRTRMSDSISGPARTRLAMKIRELRQELWEKYEIEAKTLAIQSTAPTKTVPAETQEIDAPPQGETVPSPGTESINRVRARTVAKVIEELDILRPLILGPKDYLDLRPKFADFVTFEVTERHPALKDKLLHIQDHSRRHYRLAQEIAGAYHGRKLTTIQTDWKRFKPAEFKIGSGGKKTRHR
jgi:hypothetical protein